MTVVLPDDYVIGMLDKLATDIQFETIKQNDQTRQLAEQVASLKSEYERNRDNAKTPEEKSAFASYQKALAAGLPGMTQGTLAAVTAFQQQPPDAIAGSAAVMQICASLSSALGGLSMEGGPPGAALGALFSMISMILTFFAPKPPSLMSQIEALMRDLQGELEESKIQAAADAVRIFAEGCDNMVRPLDGGKVRNPRELTEELKRFNLVEGPTIMTMRVVRHWLEQAGNQDLNAWPEILQLHNAAYMQLTMAVTRVKLYAHDDERIKNYVPPNGVDPVAEWRKLQVEANVKYQNLKSNNGETSDFFKRILPIAQKRGTYAIAFSSASDRQIYAATGPKAFRENKFSSIFDNCRRMSLTRPSQGVNNPSAAYDLWVLDAGDGAYLFHNYLNIRTRALKAESADYVGDPNDHVGRRFLDVAATQAADGTYVVYGTRNSTPWNLNPLAPSAPGGNGPAGALEAHKWNRDRKTWGTEDWRPVTTPKLLTVRIAAPLAVQPDDPERDDMPADMLAGGYIIYGTLENSKDIFVYVVGPTQNQQTTVPIPMDPYTGSGRPWESYTGIAVDSNFLWVYGSEGFLCATHASVMSCIAQKRSSPRWLYQVGQLAPVLDLSSCEDGTLLVSTPDRLATAAYSLAMADGPVSEQLLLAGQWMTFGEWEDFVDQKGAAQVQKLPMYGWPLLERSIAAVTP